MAKSANLYARIEPEIKSRLKKFSLHWVFRLLTLSICFINRLSYSEDFPLK